ncbi:chemotaxis protein CheA [Rhodosalinus halophilus]|uniref:Chemotaxis protein CheA n=1 Tax=Rhodosalinus halophilus TaxID=2259333 RepID=A0A365U3Q7_9RHOB|nr:chemotaxis protein CheA [Rhodosalinus halophilus]RBI82616.1 chemotaxis protein CheA [Rhodosalinus halophilus]
MTQIDPAETFRLEAQDVLEQLEQTLLDLGDDLDDMALVDGAFRALHTIKGSGAMFGFTEVADFVHEFETAFDRLRKGDAAPSGELVRVALGAKDHIARLIAEPNAHARAGVPILDRLRAIVGTGIQAEAPPRPVDAATPGNGPAAGDASHGWRIRFRLPEDALSLGASPALLLDELRELGDCTVLASAEDLPSLEKLDPEICHLSWDVTLLSDCSRDAVEDVFLFVEDGMQLDIAPLPAAGPRSDAAAPAGPSDPAAPPAGKTDRAGAPPRENSSLRVAAERLDELLDRVGELVIAQARLSQIAAESSNPSLMTVTEEIERLSAGLRDTTMGIRMVPIGTLFGRFRRLVHDLSAELGKDVDFVTSGEQTELDKTVIESLADPLVHVIRNAIDHGLESPEARAKAGKPRQGSVRLSAAHEGAEVAITVSDDGAGLDTDRIRRKAEASGLIASDATLSDSELHRLIFHPGFSTAQEVSAISGRGVGMDVVSRTMDALRGRIDVDSQRGRGATVTLRLPLTLAIIDGMMVRVGRNRYSIPLSAVEECVELPPDIAEGSRGRNFLRIRDKLVPFLRLRELFGTQEPEDLHQKVVIVSTGEQRVGLVVDQILGNTQTVIKSLSRLHADVETFAGATIMGDGTVALILDVANLVRSGQRFETRLRDEQTKGQAA